MRNSRNEISFHSIIIFYIVESKKEYIGGMIKSVKMDPGNEYKQIYEIENSGGFIKWVTKK